MKAVGKLWVFAPCYLDLRSFLEVRKRLLAIVDRDLRGRFTEVRMILIDDTGDQDPELRTTELPPGIEVLSPPFNVGHQRALVYGLRRKLSEIANEDFVLTLDADGEDRPEDAARLLWPLFDDVTDVRRVAVAWRTRRTESPLFKVMYALYKIFFHTLTGRIIRSGNYAAYRGWTVLHVLPHPHFDLCYSSSLVSLNLKVTDVPCERGTRYAGKSRMNFQKLLLHGIRMLMPFLDRIAVRALVFFSVLAGLGLVAALGVLCVKLFTDLALPGWATYTLLLTLLLSVISLGQFVILITIVSQSQGIALSSLDKD